MSAIDQIRLLQEPAAQAIGWALLQFVWQGALVGALSAVALFALRRSAADVRYVVATIGLTLMLTMPVVTAVQSWRVMTADAGAAVVAAQQPVAAESRSADVPPATLSIVQPARTLDGIGYQGAGDSAVLSHAVGEDRRARVAVGRGAVDGAIDGGLDVGAEAALAGHVTGP